MALFGGRTPTPKELLAADPEELRGVGLSRAKVAFLRDLAEHVEDGELRLDELAELPDEEVAAQLIAVKGLGPWTVDMFMIFHLGRPDILPVGDLGVRRAAQILHGMDELPTPAELTALAEPWRPYRSLASLYLWRSLDNTPADSRRLLHRPTRSTSARSVLKIARAILPSRTVHNAAARIEISAVIPGRRP